MRKKKRLIWQLYPSYLLITLVSLIAVTWYASGSLRSFYLNQTAKDLEARAYLLQDQFASLLSPLEPEVVDIICKDAGNLSDTRITVILPDGTVIGDSRESPKFMNNHANRQEVVIALGGGVGSSIRYSATLHQRMMYVAVPLFDGDRVRAVIRTAISVTSMEETLQAIQFKIAMGGLIIALMATGVSLYVSRRISQPIEKIRLGAEQFSGGNLAHRLPIPESAEMATLAETLNRMAAQLDDRIKTIVRQRNELGAVLGSMLEGVVAVDQDERVINMNQAAGRMLGCDPIKTQGRNFQEVIRNPALQRFTTKSLSNARAIEDDFTLYREEELVLNIHSSPLYDAGNRQVGTLLVMNDVTQLRHLENVRTDFVANVSHEIKTPLTAIKGFVETLKQEGVENPEERERFLGIILKHVDRLSAILEDLLALSRIEKETEQNEIRLAEGRLNGVIQTAIQVCQPKASAKNITFELQCPEEITARIDATLLEQALVNLIDNAVKYSENGGSVRIESGRSDSEIYVHIKDQGQGISQKHLPRLFERFYRVDKARSRKLGGTGLGLAIVKHIIQAHGGRVTVESLHGKGSTFTIHLPQFPSPDHLRNSAKK